MHYASSSIQSPLLLLLLLASLLVRGVVVVMHSTAVRHRSTLLPAFFFFVPFSLSLSLLKRLAFTRGSQLLSSCLFVVVLLFAQELFFFKRESNVICCAFSALCLPVCLVALPFISVQILACCFCTHFFYLKKKSLKKIVNRKPSRRVESSIQGQRNETSHLLPLLPYLIS